MSVTTIQHDDDSVIEDTASAVDEQTIRRATALLTALAAGDHAAAMEVVDEFIATVGINEAEFEAAMRSYEQDYALDGSQCSSATGPNATATENPGTAADTD